MKLEFCFETDAVTAHGLDEGDRKALLDVYGHKINERMMRNCPRGTLIFNDVEHMNVSWLRVKLEQGSDLRELQLTWKEIENLIFERFIRIFGDILEDFWTIFEEFWRNWFIVRRGRLRTSINWRPTKKMRF